MNKVYAVLPSERSNDEHMYRNILTTVIHALESKTLHQIYDYNKNRKRNRHEGSYEYVPFDVRTFVGILNQIKEDYKKRNGKRFESVFPKFIDAGCGLGVKLLLAAAMGFETTGVEIDCELIKRAKDIFDLDQDQECWFYSPRQVPEIIHQDILDHDYSIYDVVYFYCPFVTRAKEEEFEKRVHSQMKSGAYLMPFGIGVKPPEDQFEVIKSNARFYRKK